MFISKTLILAKQNHNQHIMAFFFILGIIISISAWFIPQSFIERHDLNRKRILYFGLSIFAIGALILVFQSLYFLLLLLLTIFIYYKYIK